MERYALLLRVRVVRCEARTLSADSLLSPLPAISQLSRLGRNGANQSRRQPVLFFAVINQVRLRALHGALHCAHARQASAAHRSSTRL